jgi:peptide methionine sulfoxide reductase msrA/msrB
MKYYIAILALFTASIAAVAISNRGRHSSIKQQNNMKEIYFAGGCFWGTEHFMKQINGVVETSVGYANGKDGIKNPTYEQVCTHTTGFAETVKVVYDPSIAELKTLLGLYFKMIDPTLLNQQGNDKGTQYRTGIYYTDPEDRPVIEAALSELAKSYSEPIVVEAGPLKSFYDAEEYHQDYLDKHPDGYCHISPELFDYARKANSKKGKVIVKKGGYQKPNDNTLRNKLTSIQYASDAAQCYRKALR